MGTCLQLPSYCVLCNKPTLKNQKLCVPCENGLPWLAIPDFQLSLPDFPHATVRIQSLFDYLPPLDRWIMRFKYKGDLFYADVLAELMVQYLSLPFDRPDCLISIPLHPTRQRERGFNQTLEIAKSVQKKILIPIDVKSCKKNRHTPSQSHFSAIHRRHNIDADVFTLSPDLDGKKVLIIEDVVTTGSTLQAFSSALKNAGVAAIDVWTCCRTEKKCKKIKQIIF